MGSASRFVPLAGGGSPVAQRSTPFLGLSEAIHRQLGMAEDASDGRLNQATQDQRHLVGKSTLTRVSLQFDSPKKAVEPKGEHAAKPVLVLKEAANDILDDDIASPMAVGKDQH